MTSYEEDELKNQSRFDEDVYNDLAYFGEHALVMADDPECYVLDSNGSPDFACQYVEQLPMSDLTMMESSSNSLDFGEDENTDDLPIATASLAELLLEPTGRARANSTGYCVDSGFVYSRPEFLFARVIKPVSLKIGIFLRDSTDPDDGTRRVVISRICPDSNLAKSNLKVGDRIISVNGKSCVKAKAKRVAKRIANSSVGYIDIVVHNKGGDATSISSYIQKKHANDKAGITLKRKRGATVVSRIESKGLFASSLVTTGHRCMFINDVSIDSLSLQTTADIIGSTTEHITLISEPRDEVAMVLSCEGERSLWRDVKVGVGHALRSMSS